MDDKSTKPAPKRRRRWLQFSLRSLMVFTALVAGLCGWLIRPETVETPLANGAMKIREQVRPIKNPQTGKLENVKHGSWTLLDRDGHRWGKGRNRADKPHGKWTFSYPNGQKMMEGECERGVLQSTWTVWLATGEKRSQTVYAKHSVFLDSPKFTDTVGYMEWHYTAADGPACQWWPGGKLRFEGLYRSGMKEGKWTNYNRAGQKIAQGSYRKDRRHGTWLFWDDPGSQPRKVQYADGLKLTDLPDLLRQLSGRLGGGDPHQRFDAAWRLERIGTAGVPVLSTALAHDEAQVRQLALRTLARIGPEAKPALENIHGLAEDDNLHTRLYALWAICTIDKAALPKVTFPLF